MFVASVGSVTEVKTDIFVTSFGPVSDVEMVKKIKKNHVSFTESALICLIGYLLLFWLYQGEQSVLCVNIKTRAVQKPLER